MLITVKGINGKLNQLAVYIFSLVVFIAIAFWPCLSNGFVGLDDGIFLLQNPYVKDLSINGILQIFRIGQIGSYHPLTTLSYACEYHFFQFDPFIYHLDSLLLHAVNAVLVFFLVLRLVASREVAWSVALLFALSPLRVESVAWVAARKDVLYAFFYLLGLLAYIRDIKIMPRPARSWWTVWVCFAAAFFSKQQALAMPVSLLLLDYYYQRRGFLRLVMEKWPLWLLMAFGTVVTLGAVAPVIQHSPEGLGVEKILLSFFTIVLYVIKVFIPFKLAILYPYPNFIDGIFPWEVYASPIIVGGIAFLLWWFFRRQRIVFFGLAFFIVNIALSLINIWFSRGMMADRYTYIASIGLYLAVCVPLVEHVKKNARWLVITLAIFFAALTYSRSGVFNNALSIWDDTISQYPQAWVAYERRGDALLDYHDVAGALSMYSRRIELHPDALAYIKRGVLEEEIGQTDQALQDFNLALQRLMSNQGSMDDMRRVQVLIEEVKQRKSFDLKRAVLK